MKKSLIFLFVIFTLVACSKNSIDIEQDLCKDATTIPQITFLKLSNKFISRNDILGGKLRIDSISITFKYQDKEGDLGVDINKKILHSDGTTVNLFMDAYKKNPDGSFLKLQPIEPFDSYFLVVPTQGGQIIKSENYPFQIKSLSNCSGEITYSNNIYLDLLRGLNIKVNDVVKFRLTIKDRALHLSNTIETTETSISENP